MANVRKKPLLPRRVLDLPIDALRPNPNQPRIEFDEASLRSLSDSIRRYGILQPLTVRRTDEGYELIAGERRLRAAKLAGLREVPCLLARSSEEESALLALIENLQRRDLHYLEEAAAIARLIATYGLSQEQAAEKAGEIPVRYCQQAAAAAPVARLCAPSARARPLRAARTGAAAPDGRGRPPQSLASYRRTRLQRRAERGVYRRASEAQAENAPRRACRPTSSRTCASF